MFYIKVDVLDKVLINLVCNQICFMHCNSTYQGKIHPGYIYFNRFNTYSGKLELTSHKPFFIRYDVIDKSTENDILQNSHYEHKISSFIIYSDLFPKNLLENFYFDEFNI